MHGRGKFKLAARDWRNTLRSGWDTGADWTFEGTFVHDKATEGIFKDEIRNGTKVRWLKFEKPVEMDRFWIRAKLRKDDDEATLAERRKINLPDALYQ